eukprot:scaffold258630_cov55-Attheya_sp.AAC.1
MGVYGDYVHQNNGTHLDGEIADDKIWQARWQKLVALPTKRYNAPGGHVGCQFIEVLVDELEGIRKRKWNSDRFIVFQMVILQRTKNVIWAKYICARIQNHLKSWKAGHYNMLVQETAQEAIATMIPTSASTKTQEQREKIFVNLMVQGKLRQAVRFITEREKAGIMLPTDIDEKSGLPVIDALRSKHPPARVPEVEDLEEYDTLPEFVRVDITDETMENVVRRLSGALPGQEARTGCYVTAALAASIWLGESTFVTLAGIRPIGVGVVTTHYQGQFNGDGRSGKGSLWQQSTVCWIGSRSGKCHSCHATHFEEHKMEEDWGFLLVDATNAFSSGRYATFGHLEPDSASMSTDIGLS